MTKSKGKGKDGLDWPFFMSLACMMLAMLPPFVFRPLGLTEALVSLSCLIAMFGFFYYGKLRMRSRRANVSGAVRGIAPRRGARGLDLPLFIAMAMLAATVLAPLLLRPFSGATLMLMLAAATAAGIFFASGKARRRLETP